MLLSKHKLRFKILVAFSLDTYYWIQPQIAKARNTISIALNAPASTITLTDNVTVGCNIAMWGIDWHPGDSILLSDSEHPGIVATAQEIGRRFAVEIIYCPIQATLNQGDPVQVICPKFTIYYPFSCFESHLVEYRSSPTS